MERAYEEKGGADFNDLLAAYRAVHRFAAVDAQGSIYGRTAFEFDVTIRKAEQGGLSFEKTGALP